MKTKLKRLIPLVLLIAFGMSMLPVSALTNNSALFDVPAIGASVVGASSVMGDINNDGTVNATDALLVLRHALSIITLSGAQLTVADCNGDGTIDVNDALILMRYCIGIPMPTPTQQTEPTFIVDNATASAGGTVQVTVRVVNNPGVAGAILRLSYDSRLTLASASVGEAFSSLQNTMPGQFSNPCNFSWDSESGMATADGTVLVLTFNVASSAASGSSLNVNITYNHGDIYDEDLNDVDFDIVNGAVTIN